MGLELSRKEAERLTAEAMDALESFGEKAARLREIARRMLDREF